MIKKLKNIIFRFKPYPCRKVKSALKTLGFTEDKKKGTSHRQFRRIVTDDSGKSHLYKVTFDCHKGEISAINLKSMVKQSGYSKEQFFKAMEL